MPNDLNIPAVRAHVKKLPEGKLRALHKTVNDPAQLAKIARDEGRTAEESTKVQQIVNAEYKRRFG